MNHNSLKILILTFLILGVCPNFAQTSQTNSITITVTLKEIVSEVIVISPDNQTGNPGETLTYNFTVKNNGSSQDNYNIVSISSNQWMTELPQGNTIGPLDPGQQEGVDAWLEIPQTALVNTEDVLTLTAISLSDSSVSNSGSVTTLVNQIAGLTIRTFPQFIRVRPGQTISLQAEIINSGNGDDSFILTAFSSLGWEMKFGEGDIIGPIEPGQRKEAQISVIIPLDAQEGEEDILTITATSQFNPSASHSSSYIAIVTPRTK